MLLPFSSSITTPNQKKQVCQEQEREGASAHTALMLRGQVAQLRGDIRHLLLRSFWRLELLASG